MPGRAGNECEAGGSARKLGIGGQALGGAGRGRADGGPRRGPRGRRLGLKLRRTRTRTPRLRLGLDGAIRVGQTLITVVLVVLGAAVAASEGAPVALVVGSAVAFLGWYSAGLWLSRHSADPAVAAWWLIGLGLIWLGAVAVSAQFVWLAFPLWLLAGFLLRLRWALVFSVLVLAIAFAAPLAHAGTTSFANIIGPLVGGVFALGIARGYLELVRDRRQRRRLVATLVAAQKETTALQDELARTQRESGASAERARLSRDIHDTVAQSVSSIGMLAGTALEDGSENQRVRALQQIQALAKDGLVDIRRIVNALMPAELEGSAALRDALQRLLVRLAEETGIRAVLHADGTVPALGLDAEVALLRTAQSALANVRTHSGATRVVLTLSDAGDAVRLDIVDDGCGFDAARWHTHAATSGRRGSGRAHARAASGAVRDADARAAANTPAGVIGPRDASASVVGLGDVSAGVIGLGDVSAGVIGPGDVSAGGYGLRSMRARLRELGGGLDVESAPGDGTALSAFLPLGARTAHRVDRAVRVDRTVPAAEGELTGPGRAGGTPGGHGEGHGGGLAVSGRVLTDRGGTSPSPEGVTHHEVDPAGGPESIVCTQDFMKDREVGR